MWQGVEWDELLGPKSLWDFTSQHKPHSFPSGCWQRSPGCSTPELLAGPGTAQQFCALSHVSALSNPMDLFQAQEREDSFPPALSTHSQAIKSTLHSVSELGWRKDNVQAGFLCLSSWQDLGRVRGWLCSSIWLNLKTRSCSALGALGYQAAKTG